MARTVKVKKTSKTADDAVKAPSFDMSDIYDKAVSYIEKKRTLSPFVSPLVRVSSGLLATDIITGGGIPVGRYTQWSGPEAGGKSTNVFELMAQGIIINVPVLQFFDAEKAVTESLFKNICRHRGVKQHSDLFGVESLEGGSWLIKPRIRLYKHNSLEVILFSIKDMLQKFPHKIFLKSDNTWYYVFDDKKGVLDTIKKAGLDKPSDLLYKRTSRYWTPAPDGGRPQAIYALDSWPAMLPPSFLEEGKDASKQRAQQAAFIAQHLGPVIGEIESKHAILCGVNQIRQNPNANFGPTEYEPMGNALKYLSSVRNQNRPRAFEGNNNKPVAVEASVEADGQQDTYHYKLLKNTKNKTSTPLLSMWSRIWVSDYEGQGRGYDPVFDTFMYLKATGQIVKGNKTKFTIRMGGPNDREYQYMDFKRTIMAEVTISSAIRKKLMQELKLQKVPTLRAECFKQIQSGKGLSLITTGSHEDEDDE